jgi:hypothetical protein
MTVGDPPKPLYILRLISHKSGCIGLSINPFPGLLKEIAKIDGMLSSRERDEGKGDNTRE